MSEDLKDIEWFKSNIVPLLKGYKINYKYFNEGDFGNLNQVEFNSKKIGGNLDFWGLGWVGVFVWNYDTEEQLLNTLIEPNQIEEKEKVLRKLLHILQMP